MSNNVINIVLTCDDRYVQHAAVTIISVVKNTKRNVHFYVFDCGILPENLERLKQLNVGSNVLEVIQVQKIEAFENREYHNGYSPAVMYRLLIPKILPHLDKALYLDSDIIAVRDIGLVYDLDLGDKLLAGNDALELYEDQVADVECGFSCGKVYFHTGFLLMNLGKMREWNFCEKAIEVVKNAPSFTCPDQEVIYLVLREEHIVVVSITFFLWREALGIIRKRFYHYCFLCHLCTKPWIVPPPLLHYLPVRTFDVAYKYYLYLEMTPFREFRYRYVSFLGSFRTILAISLVSAGTFISDLGCEFFRGCLRKLLKTQKNVLK